MRSQTAGSNQPERCVLSGTGASLAPGQHLVFANSTA